MVLNPEIQVRAQEEISSVLGVRSDGSRRLSRLPTLSDRPKMPYVDALVKEVYRWSPTVPLGQWLFRSSSLASMR
jgi:cytochrome P450